MTTYRTRPATAGFDLTDQSLFAGGFPYGLFARLRRETPVFFHPGPRPGADGFWVFTRYSDISLAAARDPGAFSAQGGASRVGGGSHLEDLEIGVLAGVMMPMLDDPRHALLRRAFAPALCLPDAEARLRGFADDLVAETLAGGTFNAARLAERFAVRCVSALLGVPARDLPQLEYWAASVTGFVNRRTGEVDDDSRRVFAEILSYANALVAAKRVRPDLDATSVLARAELPEGHDQPPITQQEREVNFQHFLLTGVEQPRNTIAGGLHGFATHPDQWRELRADRALLPSAVEEVLRWAPPNPYNRRTATRDVQLRDQLIRAGDKVTLWWPSANRDESVFAGPDRFDVARNPNPHLSFGHGPHHCLGDEFARLQVRVLLEALLARVAEIDLAGPVRWAPNSKHTVVLDLPVVITRSR
ncbi:MAG TPA: cytochrome P450 [Pseudonocardiaceae bacterium]